MMEFLVTHFAAAASQCSGGGFFGFPTWYEYLKRLDVTGQCTPQITGIADIWLIVAAVIDILLRIAALAAIVFVIYGGVEYMTSQGEPDKTSKARNTIINAAIGLVISVTAAGLVTYIAGRFK